LAGDVYTLQKGDQQFFKLFARVHRDSCIPVGKWFVSLGISIGIKHH